MPERNDATGINNRLLETDLANKVDRMDKGWARRLMLLSDYSRTNPQMEIKAMQTLEERDQEMMSEFYGVFVEEAGKTAPPNWDMAMMAVTKAIVKQVDVMEHGEMCQRVAHALMDRFCHYADGIHDQANRNIAARKKPKTAGRRSTGQGGQS